MFSAVVISTACLCSCVCACVFRFFVFSRGVHLPAALNEEDLHDLSFFVRFFRSFFVFFFVLVFCFVFL